MGLLKSAAAYLSKHFGVKPSVSLDELDFVVRPQIIKRGKKYFLRYQLAATEPPQLIRPIQTKEYDGKGYYFFGLAVNQYDVGELVERDISLDGFDELVNKEAIYWLNKDDTEILLEVKPHPALSFGEG